jgi:multimeric flavodoxin WrbA
MSKPVVILGSARSDGETLRAISLMFSKDVVDIIDLNLHAISAYDYEHANDSDDFLKIIECVQSTDTVIFATPVYWYSMSGALKIFFDRLADLITIHKKTGRSLAGKGIYLIATGTDEALPDGFEVPFLRTADYLDMVYLGAAYLYTGDDRALRAASEDALREFAFKL